jgi:hypothetical protein
MSIGFRRALVRTVASATAVMTTGSGNWEVFVDLELY